MTPGRSLRSWRTVSGRSRDIVLQQHSPLGGMCAATRTTSFGEFETPEKCQLSEACVVLYCAVGRIGEHLAGTTVLYLGASERSRISFMCRNASYSIKEYSRVGARGSAPIRSFPVLLQ